LVLLVAALAPATVRAQSTWQFSAYENRVWVAVAPRAELGRDWVSALGAVLPGQAQATYGATWNLAVLTAPDKVGHALATREAPPPAERVDGAGELKDIDKLYAVGIDFREGEYQLRVRELDVRSRIWSNPEERSTASLEAVPLLVWDAIRAAFT